LRLVAVEPSAVSEQNRLVWQLGSLECQEERRIKLELTASSAREVTIEPRATFTGSATLKTRIVQQPLTAIQSGPTLADRGSKVVIQIQVTNNTAQPMHRLMVRDHLPRGLQHPQGDQIEAEIGTLAPGEKRTFPLEVETTQPGRVVNELMVWSQEGQVARSRWTIQINETALQQQVSAPREAGLSEPVDVRLDVYNAGPAPVRKVQMSLRYSAGLEAIAISEGGQPDSAGRSASWQVDTLGPKQTHTVVLRLRGVKPGQWSYQTQVTAEGSSPSQSARVLLIGATQTAGRSQASTGREQMMNE
jgi:hypothetical protein